MIFNLENLRCLPSSPGVYKFKNAKKQIIYIGKAKNLKKRVSSYFSQKQNNPLRIKKMISQIQTIEITLVNNEFEALILEAKEIKFYQPKYNIEWKDDKHYLYVKITKEEFPKVLLFRRNEMSVSIYGPFPSSKIVKDLLKTVRKIIPFCQQRKEKNPCFYTHLGLCQPCPGNIRKLEGKMFELNKKQYRRNIQKIKNLLEGKVGILKKYFSQKMEFYSNKQNFEVAAQFRDRLKNLEILLSTSFSGSSEENQELISIPTVDQFATQNDHTEGYTDTLSCKFKYEKYILKKTHLNLTTLRRIECYDVSHTGGKNIVGSMVTFINNLPAKEYYRRFKIIKQNKIDDFAALKEIFIRRLNHPEWGFSDLVIVDGGTPQVRVFQKVFSYFGIKIPLIGIAKETDILIIPFHNGFKRIALSANSPTLHLIQRIRDEAHRFAHKYHSFLRSNQFKQVEKRL